MALKVHRDLWHVQHTLDGETTPLGQWLHDDHGTTLSDSKYQQAGCDMTSILSQHFTDCLPIGTALTIYMTMKL